MPRDESLGSVFIVWAFIFQVVLIVHFAVRKVLFETYTLGFGWWVYGLFLPAVAVSILMRRGGWPWHFSVGGLLCLVWSVLGYWSDYVVAIPWRIAVYLPILVIYVVLYLGMIMFYWFPLALVRRSLWYIYAVLFIIGTYLNIISH